MPDCSRAGDEPRRADGSGEVKRRLDARLALTVLPSERRRRPITVRALVVGLVAVGGGLLVLQTGADLAIESTVAAAADDRAAPVASTVTPPTPTSPARKAPAPTAPAPTAPAPTSPVAETPVTLAFGGDVHAESGSGVALRAGLPSVRDVLGRADVAMLNLEAAVTDGGTRADKQYVYRAPASTLVRLKDAGVDVVTLANNHGLDYGRSGLRDTLAASAAAGLPVVGIGLDEDQAYAPHVVEVRGQRIAVLGATQVLDGDMEASWTAGPQSPGLASAKREARLLEEVSRARGVADTVVVYLHWGRELDACPLPRQQDLARALVAAGADVVVGTHAHVLLGGGWLGGAYVDYGLGNFVFGARSAETTRTGVLTLSVSGRSVTTAEWTPARVRSGAPRLLTGGPARSAVADKDRRRACTGLSATP